MSRRVGSFPWAVLAKCTLWLLPLGYGASLVWEERVWRQAISTPTSLPVQSPEVPNRSAPFNPSAVLAVIGLAGEGALAVSSEPLVLRGSFVSSEAESRALLFGSGAERIYRVGERLPGGSVLRRVESHRVILWRNGREESLSLGSTGSRTLEVVSTNSAAETPSPAPLYLQPAGAALSSD